MKLREIIILTLIAGLGLLAYSFTQPYYTNKVAAEQLLINSSDLDHKVYEAEMAKLKTNKTTFMDLGSGIAIASLTLLLFLYSEKVKRFSDLKRIKTSNKLFVFIGANIAWLLLIPGTYWYYWFRGMRGDYPPFVDSLGIPIMEQTRGYLYLLIPLNVFILLTTIKTKLPATLWLRPEHYNRKSRLWEMLFGFCLLINLLTLILFVVDGDHISIIVNLFFTFILLTLRAGQLNSPETEKK